MMIIINANISICSSFLHTGGLSSGIEQLRTCDRCHRIFPVLSDLFNHMCDDEQEELIQRKSAMSSSIPSSISSNRHTSENSIQNPEKLTADSKNSLDTNSPSNQRSSARSFKLHRRSSFNDSPGSSLRSNTKLFSPPSSPSVSQTVNPKHDTKYNIPFHKRPLFRTDSTRISSSPSSSSSRTLLNDKPHHSSNAYVYLANPTTSPMRVIS